MASRPFNRRTPSPLRMALIVAIVFLSVNLIAALAYRSYRKGPAADRTTETVGTAPEARPPVREDGALLRARRAQAVDAIETGDYDAAVRTLTEIVKSGRGVGDEPELLRIAKDLQEKHTQKAASSPATAMRETKPEPEPAPVAARPPPEPPKEKEPAKRPDPKHAAKPAKPPERKVASAKPVPVMPEREREREREREPETGQVLVMSVPSSLTAEVDGTPAGSTPTRYTTAPGVHTVTLYKGSQKVGERTVTVGENAVATVDFDVRDQLQPPPPLAMKEQPEKEAPPPASEPEKASEKVATQPAVPQTSPAAAVAGTGEVMVPPVSLAGNVYINGRSYGPPPVLARDVPAGTATVELRVGDAVKRSKVVAVEARQRATVKFR